MKKNKWISFFLAIFMFVTMVGINSYSSYNQTKADSVHYANTVDNKSDLIKESPTGKRIYLVDPNGVLRTTELHEEGQIKAIVRVVRRVDKYYDFNLTDNGTNVFSGSFNSINEFIDKLADKWIKIIYTHKDGTVEETEEVDISKSLNEFLQANDKNQDVLISIDRINGKLTLGSSATIFNGQSYLYFAYQAQPGEVVYCEYQNGDGNTYKIPMVLTSLRYSSSQIPAYRACIYCEEHITNLKFIIIDYTQDTINPVTINAITKSTHYDVWHNKVYYKTEKVDEHNKNWHKFTGTLDSYVATFYSGRDKDNNLISYDTETASRTENFLITIPANPTMEGKTFVGWNALISGAKQDFFAGDTIFLNENISYIAEWEDGICISVFVDNFLLASAHAPNENISIRNISLIISPNEDLSTSKTYKMKSDNRSKCYKAVIPLSLNKTNIEIKSCALEYYVNGIKYQTNTMLTGTINTNNHRNLYHIVIPETMTEDAQQLKTTFEFKPLYKVTYKYNDGWKQVLNYWHVSVKEVYPLFIERPSYKLEGWYTGFKKNIFGYDTDELDLKTKYNHKELTKDITLYANYIYNRDYYIYLDNYENHNLNPVSITMYNDYFSNHKVTYTIPSDHVKSLGHDIYQIRLEVSKSFTNFYVNVEDKQGNSSRTTDAILDTKYTYFNISAVTDTVDGEERNKINHEKYGDCLVGAQKLPYDSTNKKNAFRFTIGVPNEINDYYQTDKDPTKPPVGKQTNLGFKVIFVKKDGTCYVGFWNFDPTYRLDYINLDKLYESNVSYIYNEQGELIVDKNNSKESRKYNGFYSLTIRDDIAFNYSDYEHIIIIGVYKATGATAKESKLVVVKATEYKIVTRTEGNVDIFYQDNHVIE